MEWKRERPTRPGWYWCLPFGSGLHVLAPGNEPHVMHLLGGDIFLRAGGSETFAPNDFGPLCEWAGPIEPPPLPEAQG